MSLLPYLIGCHRKVLPSNIINMLIDSLVFSHFVYGLPVCGPSLSVNLLHRITRLHNRGVRMTSGLRKCDHRSHDSHHRLFIGWLPVSSVIHLVSMYKQSGVIIVCWWIRQSSLGVKVHTIPELQLALQTFFDTIYLIARTFFDQRQQTGGMICQ